MNNKEDRQLFMAFFQREIDWLLMRSFVYINSANSTGISYFLSNLPFESISVETSGQIFLSLYQNRPISYYNDSGVNFSFLKFDNWIKLVESNPKLRDEFALYLSKRGDSSIHIIHAIQSLALNDCSDLLLIWLMELFQVIVLVLIKFYGSCLSYCIRLVIFFLKMCSLYLLICAIVIRNAFLYCLL